MSAKLSPIIPLDTVKEFTSRKAVWDSDSRIWIGIDPGSVGGIAFLCDRELTVVNIPAFIVESIRRKKTTAAEFATTGRKTKNVEGSTTKFNHAEICAIFALFDRHVKRVTITLEVPPPTLGPGRHHADVMLARAYGMWPLFLCSKEFATVEVSPVVWKTAMGLRGKDKSASTIKATSMFPRADLRGDQRKAEGRAEALLLAEYGRLTTSAR